MTLVIEVETPNGKYVVNKPKGKIGIKHATMMMKLARVYKDVESTEIDVLDDDRFIEIYEQWCNEVLPHIIVSTPFGKSVDEIPFDDMIEIFLAVATSVSLSQKNVEEVVESFQNG